MEVNEVTIPVVIRLPFDIHTSLRYESKISKENGKEKKTLEQVIRNRILRDMKTHPVPIIQTRS